MSTVSPAPWAYASIMVAMDPSARSEGRAQLSAGLADRFSSRLIGIAAVPIQAPLYFEAPVEGVPGIVELEERRSKEDLAMAETVFRRAVGTRNRVEWRQALTIPRDYILEQARAADLIVVDRPRPMDGGLRLMNVDGSDLVMDAGRPVLFVPPSVSFLSAKRVVIAWKDAREARRAVWDSMPFLKQAAEVSIVAIDIEGRSAQDVAKYLECHGIVASVLTRPESQVAVAVEIVRIAQQEGADLIVCGAYGHSRAREWAFGGVTRDLLDGSPLCCLMAH
jgi:nucleotide-binding universal stress UspA family protein